MPTPDGRGALPTAEVTGYLHENYARSLSEFGSPLALSRSGGWLLERPIPLSGHHDAMGCYPLFACRNWSELRTDLEALTDQLVSVTVVSDPFGEYDQARLRNGFEDLVLPFKEHFVTDLSQSPGVFVSKHHRYYARKASAMVNVEPLDNPSGFIDPWMELYACLAERHRLTGLKAFSRVAFERQLRVPGLVVLRATHDDAIVGAHLWYVQGDVAYSHLAAFSTLGYQLSAAYAMYQAALDYFAGRVRWLDLGAGAGLEGTSADGLTQFKRGWSTGTRTAYLCGRVLQPEKFRELSGRAAESTRYFPAYRAGELA